MPFQWSFQRWTWMKTIAYIVNSVRLISTLHLFYKYISMLIYKIWEKVGVKCRGKIKRKRKRKLQSILHLRLLLGNCKSSATTEKYGKFLLLFNFLYLKYQFTKKPKFYFKNVLFQKKKKTPYNAYNRKQYLWIFIKTTSITRGLQ